MAQRRMFSSQIVDSDAFLDMSPSTQNLYFHLGMRADDDGFIGNPKKIMKIVGANDDELKMLLAKRFLLGFEDGVVVIKHWLIHNLIRADLYKETLYKKEKKTLGLNENGAYTELREGITELKTIETPEWLKLRRKDVRTVSVPLTALRIGKDRLENKEIDKSISTEFLPLKTSEEIVPLTVLIPTDEEGNFPSPKKDKVEKVTDERIGIIIDEWNKYPIASVLGKGCVPNKTSEKELLPPATKNFALQKRIKDRLKYYPDLANWNKSIKKYIEDIINRQSSSEYAQHRFSLYDFVNQDNGFIKFVNK